MDINICGKNALKIPTSGCGDCAELEYRIKKLEDWQEDTITEAELEELTPMDCYVPPKAKPIVCIGEVCSAKLCAVEEEIEPTESETQS